MMRLINFKASFNLFCFVLMSGYVQGQADVVIGNNVADHLLILSKTALPRIEFEDIQGSMYVNDTFIQGIVATNRDTFYNLPMKYNIYEDVVEFQYRGQVHLLEPGAYLKKIQIDQLTLVVAPYQDMGKGRMGYFTELADGKVKLLGKKLVEFQEMQLARAMHYTNTPAKFVASPDLYYIWIGTNDALPIKNIKKTIALFPDHQKSLLSFVKRRKVSANKKEELVALWKYYNTLN